MYICSVNERDFSAAFRGRQWCVHYTTALSLWCVHYTTALLLWFSVDGTRNKIFAFDDLIRKPAKCYLIFLGILHLSSFIKQFACMHGLHGGYKNVYIDALLLCYGIFCLYPNAYNG